jgi:ATP-binding cassette, sub-family E, member 1
MNQFLDQLNITFRRDPTNHRPRINKLGSVKDREQKASGNFFFSDSHMSAAVSAKDDDGSDDEEAPAAASTSSGKGKGAADKKSAK